MRRYITVCFFINPQTLEKWALQPPVDKFPTALGSCQPVFLIRCDCQNKEKTITNNCAKMIFQNDSVKIVTSVKLNMKL